LLHAFVRSDSHQAIIINEYIFAFY
jgi:hypothetical protein